jgi:hypothetical protein
MRALALLAAAILLATRGASGPIAVFAPASSPIEGEESPEDPEMSLAGEASIFERHAEELARRTSLPSHRPAGGVASSARAPRDGFARPHAYLLAHRRASGASEDPPARAA